MGKTTSFSHGAPQRKYNFFQEKQKFKFEQESLKKPSTPKHPSNIIKKADGPCIRGPEKKFLVARHDRGQASSSRRIDTVNDSKQLKKPFDKKSWRLQTYSKRYKLQQWEDTRKKGILKQYYQTLQDEPKVNVKKIYEDCSATTQKSESNHDNNCHSLFKKRKKQDAFKKAHTEFERIKEQKNCKWEEVARKKVEKEKAMQEYKKKKAEKSRKLSRKTKKGQPIMKEHIEILLEKIQNSVAN